MDEIVFLRPWAFFFLIPAFLFCFRPFGTSGGWINAADAHLLPFLFAGAEKGRRRFLSYLSFFAIACAVAAMAGISVRREGSPLYAPKTPAVIMADLSLSMRAGDIFPNRFSVSQFKIYDLLDGLRGMPVGFGVFAAEPYALLPTTTDAGVTENILPLLNFDLIPVQGSRIDRALSEAVRMLKASGARGGDVFLLTDGGEEVLEQQDAALKTAEAFADNGGRVFILGIGTTQGAPLMRKPDEPIRDRLGNPVRHSLKEAFLKRLAVRGNGAYASVAADGSDTAFLLNSYARLFRDAEETDMKNDEEIADGGWMFLIPPLLLFPFLFGKGVFGILLPFLLLPSTAQAADWFLNAPALAEKALNGGDVPQALLIAREAEDFKTFYNVGTLLIKAGKYDEAVEMLRSAVALKPDSEDAQINLEIAERLRKKPPSDGGNGKNKDDPKGNGNNSGNEGKGSGENGKTGSSDNEEDNKNNINENIKNNEQHTDNKKNDAQNNTEEQSGETERQNGEKPAERPLGEKGGGDESSDRGQGGGTPGIPDDPSLLLKQKILFQHLSGRYPDDVVKGAEW